MTHKFDVDGMTTLLLSYFQGGDASYAKLYVEFVFGRQVSADYTGYCEEHHLIPVSLDDDYETTTFNLFRLRYVDHILAHYLLWRTVGDIDAGAAKKGLHAVCMPNKSRADDHPMSLTKCLADISNNRYPELSFDVLCKLVNVDTSDYIDTTGKMQARPDELCAIIDGDEQVMDNVRRRVESINIELELSAKRAEEAKTLVAPYTFTSIFDDVELVCEDTVVESDDVCLPYRYSPYPHQSEIIEEFFDMLEGESTKKRFVLCWHRRCGKDVTFWQLVVAAAATVVGDYCYMLPSNVQARKVIINGTVNDEHGNPCKFIDFIPPSLGAEMKSTESRITLNNGSSIYIVGSDNFDGLVGMNISGAVFSEYSLCNPKAYDFIAPMLRRRAQMDPRAGWALFCFTPRGKNHAYDLTQIAQMEKNQRLFYYSSKTIEDTVDHKGNRLISDKDIEEELDAGADPDILKQEYYLDFDAAVKGIIYGKQLEIARNEGRIRSVQINPKTPVLTFWDIGVSDQTSIWFIQPDGESLNVINYYENTGEGVEHYVDYLKQFSAKHGVKYGKVYLPHDGRNREWIAGKRRHEVVAEHGFDTFIIPRTTDVEIAITQTKGMFHRFVFDDQRCFHGLKHLDMYRRKVNSEGTYGAPHHDDSSNAADALRQIGQYYADKFVSKEHDHDHIDAIQSQMDEELEAGCYDYYDYDYDS